MRLRERVGQRSEKAIDLGVIVVRGKADAQPTIDAEEEWFQLLLGTVMAYATYFASCTPGYLNNEGLPPDESGGRGAAYMRSAVEFKDLLAAWRADGSYVGLVRTPVTR